MLVHPVGHQAAEYALAPPRRRAHPGQPGGRGVPVVDHIVVVEDHAAGDRGQQPADLRVEPGLVVEVGVFLVVGDLLPRRLGEVAAAGQYLRGRLGGLVGVDLVTQQEQHIGAPPCGTGGQCGGEGVQGVRADRVVPRVRGRRGPAAGAEGEVQGLLCGGGEGADGARGEAAAGQWPYLLLVVEQHPVGRLAAGCQTGHRDQRVVVPGDLPGVLCAGRPVVAPDVHGARPVGLHPHRRAVRVDVPQ